MYNCEVIKFPNPLNERSKNFNLSMHGFLFWTILFAAEEFQTFLLRRILANY